MVTVLAVLMMLSMPVLVILLAILNLPKSGENILLIVGLGLLSALAVVFGLDSEANPNNQAMLLAGSLALSWWTVGWKLRLVSESASGVQSLSSTILRPKAFIVLGTVLLAVVVAWLGRYEFFSTRSSTLVEVRDRWTGKVYHEMPTFRR